MPGACDGGNRSGGERTTVHDRGVELVAPFRGEHRTAAGIEERIVLHEHDCRLDGIKRSEDRKRETRKKIWVGAWALNEIAKDPSLRAKLVAHLRTVNFRKGERELFEDLLNG